MKNLQEILESLQKQSKDLENMFIKVQGAIELVNAMIAEESGKKEEPKEENPQEDVSK